MLNYFGRVKPTLLSENSRNRYVHVQFSMMFQLHPLGELKNKSAAFQGTFEDDCPRFSIFFQEINMLVFFEGTFQSSHQPAPSNDRSV